MPWEAKHLLPSGSGPEALHSAFEDAASGGVTVLAAPPGNMLTEGLASALTSAGRHPLWLRLGTADRDPGAFLVSLIAAAQRSWRDVGRATLRLMKARPGPVFGWAPLFAQLARELRAALAGHGALVLEDAHHAWAGCPTLALAGADLLPELAEVAPCVLLAHHVPRRAPLAARRPGGDIRLPAQAVERVLGEYTPTLTRKERDRGVSVIGGRAAVVAGLRHVHQTPGGHLTALLQRSAGWEELLARCAHALLADDGSEARSALALAMRVGYTHPDLASALGGSPVPSGPWLQRLEDGWARVRPCWRTPLREVLGHRAEPGHDTLRRAAEWLSEAGADEEAISLYTEVGDPDCAARVVAGRATALVDLGQWATLESWLAHLPDEAVASYPDLIYCRADIAAARGQEENARRWFEAAASQCTKRNDVAGACRSMLGASALAADRGDLAAALARAHAVGSLADTGDLAGAQMWASWQQGRLQLVAGDTDSALASFCRAASVTTACPTAAAAQPVLFAGQLAEQVSKLRREQEAHREAQDALKRAEHDALNQLLAGVRVPAWGCDEVLTDCGWSHAPAPLKLPGLGAPNGKAPGGKEVAGPGRPGRPLAGWWRAFRSTRGTDSTRRGARPGSGGTPGAVAPRRHPRLMAPESGDWPQPPAVPRSHPPAAAGAVPDAGPAAAGGAGTGPLGLAEAAVPAARQRGAGSELAVHLLGSLCVAVDDVPVEDWPSARCRSLFGYLLAHRDPWPARDVLMEVFWPESSPEASRNSLNVAMHALRRTLRTATSMPVIMHSCGVYRIHPDLRLWLDVEEFDRRAAQARRLAEAGEPDAATREYESADGLYRGDFLADDPYEEWAALSRERLRLTHLDALSRLSHLHFKAGRYAASASLCQRIIERDPCREDAHRRLMRCYSRQGQPHLALMQYRVCVRALTEELGVDPDPATAGLQNRIRGHEPV